MNRLIVAAIRCSLIFLLPTVTYAISTQWDLDPISGDWNTAANWTPNGVPNGSADTATFGLSNTTDVSISANTEVNGITFTAAATNPYSFEIGLFEDNSGLTLSGTGITNNSGIEQAFEVDGVLQFSNSSTAGSASILNLGGTSFFNTSTAGSANIFTLGVVSFLDSSTAGSANIGTDEIGDTEFVDTSTAGSATVGGDGFLVFRGASQGGTARVVLSDHGGDAIGVLDISTHNAPGVTIGSLEDDSIVVPSRVSAFLGANNLTVGSNNLSTIFSGVIRDGGLGGSLTKIGTGTLDLTGANTYTGVTNINGGVLQVDGSISSNTFVNHRGTLAGTGTINGNVTNNGRVSPGALAVPGVLTVVHNYTQAQFATLMIQIAGLNTGDFSVLNVLGNANLNGFLDPVLLNGFVPTIGDSFVFLNYGSLTGGFSHILHQVFNNGTEQWNVVYQPNEAILTVAQHTPDQGSTFLLFTLGLLGLMTYRRQLLRGQV